MDDRAQRAYNWAFGTIRSHLRRIPLILPLTPGPDAKNPQYLAWMEEVYGEVADQFDRIYTLTESTVHRDAARAMREIQSLLQSRTDSSFDYTTEMIQKILAILKSTKKRLEAESPLQFTSRWLNPFKQWPQKLPE